MTGHEFGSSLKFRLAEKRDLSTIIGLLRDDNLGKAREAETSSRYEAALETILANQDHELTVAEIGAEVVGTYHLVFVQYLTHHAMMRAQIEAVRVASQFRGKGIGKAMLHHAIERARQRGCGMVQLTTDKRRLEAVRFYESIGFVASHEGMKLMLPQ